MSGKHARLAASAAHRWLHCAGSVDLSAGKETSSVYAAAGTFAHEIAARCLMEDASPSDFLLLEKVIDGYKIICDAEMVDAINIYLDDIVADRQPGDECWVEMSLFRSLQTIDRDLGGTADHVRYREAAKHLRVTDFKFGSGSYVEADDNEQLMIYALGAMLEVNMPITDVEIVIVQPRFEGAQPVRSWTFKAVEILEFIHRVKEAAALTRLVDGPLTAGEHCKFCPAAASCPELEKKHHALIAQDFLPGIALTPAKLAEALISIPLIKERIKALEEYAYTEALKGTEIPGFKLVDKRAVRRWKSEGDVIEWAQKQGLDPYAPRELLSPKQIEERLAEKAPRGKKKESGKMLEPFVEKVSSGKTLAPVSDDRPPAKLVTVEDFDVCK